MGVPKNHGPLLFRHRTWELCHLLSPQCIKKEWVLLPSPKDAETTVTWSGRAIRSPFLWHAMWGLMSHDIYPQVTSKEKPFQGEKHRKLSSCTVLKPVAVWHIASMSIQIPVHPMSIFIGTSHTVVSARIEDFRPIASQQQQQQHQQQQQQQQQQPQPQPQPINGCFWFP